MISPAPVFKLTPMTPETIRRRYYLLSGANTLAASLIWGVNTLFLMDAGLSLSQVFIVNASFTAAMTLFEIPTGAVADSRGRRVSLQWSSLMLFVGTLGYLAAGTWGGHPWAFIAASVVLGLGFTFFSGAAEAWAVDELEALGDTGGSTSLFANAATASGIMMLGGTVLGGFLATLDYRIPYLTRAVLFLFMLALTTFAMPETGWKPDDRVVGPWERVRKTASDSIRYGLGSAALRRLMGVSALLGLFMMWGFYAIQPYITELAGMPGAAWLSGLTVAGITLSQIFGQTLASKLGDLPRVGGRLQVSYALAAVGVALTGIAGLAPVRDALGVPGAPVMAGVGMFIMAAALGYAGPFQRYALHSRVTSENRATVVSLDSLVSSGGAIVGQPALGWLGGRAGIASGYLVGAIIFFLVQPVLALFRRSEAAEKV